jgi:putative oxidoreductase
MRTQASLQWATVAYEALTKIASSFQSLLLLAVRLYWGWQFAQTGWGKLQHLPKVTNFFASLGISAPGFMAPAISWLEFVGGIAFALGIGSRFWGLLLAGDMVAAYLTAGRQNLLSVFTDPGKFYGDDAYTFLFASVLVLIFGPGSFAIDAVLQRTLCSDRSRHSVPSAAVGTARPLGRTEG